MLHTFRLCVKPLLCHRLLQRIQLCVLSNSSTGELPLSSVLQLHCRNRNILQDDTQIFWVTGRTEETRRHKLQKWGEPPVLLLNANVSQTPQFQFGTNALEMCCLPAQPLVYWENNLWHHHGYFLRHHMAAVRAADDLIQRFIQAELWRVNWLWCVESKECPFKDEDNLTWYSPF